MAPTRPRDEDGGKVGAMAALRESDHLPTDAKEGTPAASTISGAVHEAADEFNLVGSQ
jgi:hypothetical protein